MRLDFGLVVVAADVALAMIFVIGIGGHGSGMGRVRISRGSLWRPAPAAAGIRGDGRRGGEGRRRGCRGGGDDDDRRGIVAVGNYGEGEGCVDGDDDDLGPVRWMARAIVALTPAAEFRFVAEEYGVLYSLGAAGGCDDDGSTTVGGIGIVTDAADERRLATLALDAASTSRGGERVALPRDHPSSKGLLPAYATRAVLVQRMDFDESGGRRWAADDDVR